MNKYLFIILIIVISALVFIYVPVFKDLSINPFQEKTLQGTTMDSIKHIDVAEFRSSFYLYKTIFPFDFIYGEPLWGALLYKNPRFLSEEDKQNIEFYNDCLEIGVDLNRDINFFTITTKAYAGFQIDEYLIDPIINLDEVEKRIILKEPASVILSLEVLDNLKEEGFPDVNLTPNQWKNLVNLLLPKIEEEIVNRGLIESSKDSNRLFIENIFTAVGWAEVRFK